MPGKKHISRIATNIRPRKGITPQITSFSGMSGAMFLMTKMFSPTGGWISPISITIVIVTPNQIRSKPASFSGGKTGGPNSAMLDDHVYTMAEKVEMLPRVVPFVVLLIGVMVALYGGYAKTGLPDLVMGAPK